PHAFTLVADAICAPPSHTLSLHDALPIYTGGAEKMLGNGDMLYKPVGVNNPIRVQGTFVRSAEIHAVIDFLKKHSGADYDEAMIDRKSTRLNSSHVSISYAVFCLKKKNTV